MLRLLVLVLLVANLLFWAWARGALAPFGFAPAATGEPERLAEQLNADAVRVGVLSPRELPPASATQQPALLPEPAGGGTTVEPLKPQAADPETPAMAAADQSAEAPMSAMPTPTPSSPSPTPTPTPTQPPPSPPSSSSSSSPSDSGAASVSSVCLQAGPFNAEQVQELMRAVATLPPASWQIESRPGRGALWMVYLPIEGGEAALAEMRQKLKAQGVDFARTGPALEPGLSLGRYTAPERAERALAQVRERGVRGARVVLERSAETEYYLRATEVDAELRAQLARLPLADKPLRACDAPAAAR